MKDIGFTPGNIFQVFLLLILSLGIFSYPCTAKEKSSKTPATSTISEGTAQGGPDVEKLMYTLSETLAENRRIRESMKELQTAFEKVTLEKSDLLAQIRKTQQLVVIKTKEAGEREKTLRSEFDSAKKQIDSLQTENKEAILQRKVTEEKLKDLNEKKKQLQEDLKGAILDKERDQLQERIVQNDAVVARTLSSVADLNRENGALREQLIGSYFDLGNLFYDLGRYEEALAQYKRVLEWNPDHAWAHHNLAVIYDYHQYQIAEAMAHYQAYLNLKLASEEAREVRTRMWDLKYFSELEPDPPLKKDFKENLKK